MAKRLTKKRAKIFLETRFYLRQSLATLFNLDPLEIPISANPGEPPILPLGMGYLSLSHCKDAIVIVWHQDKIGIDIERTDRRFNHKKLADKYFFNTNKTIDKNLFTRIQILNQWCAIEAAIKYDHGKISKDINYWQYFESKKELIHIKKKLHLKFLQINFYQWTIALASKEISDLDFEMICYSK